MSNKRALVRRQVPKCTHAAIRRQHIKLDGSLFFTALGFSNCPDSVARCHQLKIRASMPQFPCSYSMHLGSNKTRHDAAIQAPKYTYAAGAVSKVCPILLGSGLSPCSGCRARAASGPAPKGPRLTRDTFAPRRVAFCSSAMLCPLLKRTGGCFGLFSTGSEGKYLFHRVG